MDRSGLEIRSPLWRYGFAVLAVVGAYALTAGSRQLGLLEAPVAAFLAAILLTGWYAGAGPVVVATLLSVFVFDFFFVPPLYRIELDRAPHPRLAWFLMFAILAAGFSAARRKLMMLSQARRL